jgi:hypothetical protein
MVNAGGFQVGGSDSPFGVGIDGPTVGEDFIEWQCLMAGVPAESLNGLLNIISFFADHIFPVHSVYIA